MTEKRTARHEGESDERGSEVGGYDYELIMDSGTMLSEDEEGEFHYSQFNDQDR